MSTTRQSNRESLEKITTDDFGTGAPEAILEDDFDAWYQEVMDASNLLSETRERLVDARSGVLPVMNTQEDLVRAAEEGTAGPLQDITTTQRSFQTTKMRLDWELTYETVNEVLTTSNVANMVRSYFTDAFALDLARIAIAGDESFDPVAEPTLSINDGWLTIADADADSPSFDNQQDTTDDATANPTDQPISPRFFYGMLQSLEPKYRDNMDLMFMVNRNQEWAYKYHLTQRETPAGDDFLVNDGVPEAFGVPMMGVPGMPEDRAILCDPQNLIHVVQRRADLRVARDGAEVTTRDLEGIYSMFTKVDYMIEDAHAVATGSGLSPAAEMMV